MSIITSNLASDETGLKALVKRHQLIALYILLFVLAAMMVGIVTGTENLSRKSMRVQE
jgi:hypothetical protein